MKKVLVFGTFDAIHPGHHYFLREARKLGDELTAVISRDKFVIEYKGKPPVHTESERMQYIVSNGIADHAVLADRELGTYSVLKKIRPDIICLGHDQLRLKENLEEWLKDQDFSLEIIIQKPYKRHIFSSSKLNKPHYARKKLVFHALMVLAMGLWGLSWSSAKAVAGQAPSQYMVLFRTMISMISFIPLMLIRREKWKLPFKTFALIAGAAAVYTLYNHLFFKGLVNGLAGKGGIIVTTMNPLFAFMMVSVILKKIPKKLQIIGLITGLLGGVLMIHPWKYSTAQLLQSGNLLFLSGAFLWASMTLMGAQALKRASLFTYNFYLYFFSVVFNGILVFFGEPIALKELTPWFWLNMVYLGTFASALATCLYFSSTKKLGAARTSGFTFLVPAFAVIFSWILLGEHPEWEMLAGGVLCMGSVYMINRIKRTV